MVLIWNTNIWNVNKTQSPFFVCLKYSMTILVFDLCSKNWNWKWTVFSLSIHFLWMNGKVKSICVLFIEKGTAPKKKIIYWHFEHYLKEIYKWTLVHLVTRALCATQTTLLYIKGLFFFYFKEKKKKNSQRIQLRQCENNVFTVIKYKQKPNIG